MFRTIRTTFQGYKGRASYTCTCGECGKTLKRTEVVEHTVNPFNKNDDGSVRTPDEVRRRAQAEAERLASEKQGSIVTCSNCEDAPNRALLMQMASEPAKLWQMERAWGSPLHVLLDRKQVEEVYEKQDGDWKSVGYRVTAKGVQRAANLLKKDIAA